jgi:3-oxoadipate CoA-transferase beta subunit
MTIEHLDRSALSREEMAQRVAFDIPVGSYVNLGIGMPTVVADYLPSDRQTIIHTENGMLGMGPTAEGDEIDVDLINAGKVAVTEMAGASYFDQADSFAIIRGGHLDVCVLGAFQVSSSGDLANWHTGEPTAIPAVGGAMDLATGAKRVFVMMTLFDQGRRPKFVRTCSYPLTSVACVNRLYTDVAVFVIDSAGVRIIETFGSTVREITSQLDFSVSPSNEP